MKNVMTAGAALLLTTSIASAGGLDRSGQSVGLIFEEGNALQLSFGYISPSVSGDMTIAPVGSGDVAPSYLQLGGGVKMAYGDNIDVALIFDQPFGASVDYSDADAGYWTNLDSDNVLSADVTSSAITAIGRYKVDQNISVYGGLRYQTVQANVAVPLVGGYEIDSDPSSAVGYVIGAAYEIPEIALRVAVTYNSKISHEITATETCAMVCSGTPGVTNVDTPESINVDFQSGVAEDTLVFGSIRYAKWTQFDMRPVGYATATGGGNPDLGASLQRYDEDTVAYSLGVGRRFSDMLSGAVTVGYEAAQGGFAGPLAPTDGNLSVGLGGTYSRDNYEITAGARYILVGDADNAFPGTTTVSSEFRDNTAIAFGVQFTQKF